MTAVRDVVIDDVIRRFALVIEFSEVDAVPWWAAELVFARVDAGLREAQIDILMQFAPILASELGERDTQQLMDDVVRRILAAEGSALLVIGVTAGSIKFPAWVRKIGLIMFTASAGAFAKEVAEKSDAVQRAAEVVAEKLDEGLRHSKEFAYYIRKQFEETNLSTDVSELPNEQGLHIRIAGTFPFTKPDEIERQRRRNRPGS